MITFKHSGNFDKSEKFLRKARDKDYRAILTTYARQGVGALSAATPKDSGETASSWDYVVTSTSTGYKISWTNSHVDGGVVIAVILQYGHGTRNGGYVQGRDYINPAIRPIFDQIAEKAWKEVT